MGLKSGKVASIFLAAAMLGPLLCAGCTAHVRVYDPYYHDYHTWPAENGYYVQWEHDTHRDHMDFDRRSEADKKAYWDWRHQHHQ
jgi:hypothetical protein